MKRQKNGLCASLIINPSLVVYFREKEKQYEHDPAYLFSFLNYEWYKYVNIKFTLYLTGWTQIMIRQMTIKFLYTSDTNWREGQDQKKKIVLARSAEVIDPASFVLVTCLLRVLWLINHFVSLFLCLILLMNLNLSFIYVKFRNGLIKYLLYINPEI